jgi:hypothetical protein
VAADEGAVTTPDRRDQLALDPIAAHLPFICKLQPVAE